MKNKLEARDIVRQSWIFYSSEMYQKLGMWLLLEILKTKTYISGSFGRNFLSRKLGKDIMLEFRTLVYISANQSNLMTSKFVT